MIENNPSNSQGDSAALTQVGGYGKLYVYLCKMPIQAGEPRHSCQTIHGMAFSKICNAFHVCSMGSKSGERCSEFTYSCIRLLSFLNM